MDVDICARLEKTREVIRQTCQRIDRNPEDVLLVAISKTKPVEAIEKASSCGQLHFGENRAHELQEKMEHFSSGSDSSDSAGSDSEVSDSGASDSASSATEGSGAGGSDKKGSDGDEPIWHYVGPVQTNKIKYMTDRVDWIQSIYKRKHLKEIEKRAKRTGRIINALIQINISGESQKQGCQPEDLASLLTYAQSLKQVRVRGVMGMATYTNDTEIIRREFRLLKKTFDDHLHLSEGSVELEHVSMGMSNDLEIALEEGSTMVRIGTDIFGEREY